MPSMIPKSSAQKSRVPMDLPKMIPLMTFEEYLDDPAPTPSISSSIVRDLLDTAPRAVWENSRRLNPNYEEEDKHIFDLGKAAHMQWLGGGDPIVVIAEDSFRTKAAKEEKAQAYADGFTPILEKEMDRVHDMADAAEEYFSMHPDTGPPIARAKPEVSIFWREAAVACRARPDLFALPSDLGDPSVIIHYKTTGTTIHPKGMSRFASNQGWDMTAAHYHAAGLAVTGKNPIQYFAIQENFPPYLCLVCALDDQFVATAEMRRSRALHIWARCLNENNWPGHIDRTVLISSPPWHENAMIEQKDMEQTMILAGTDPHDLMRKWQAPKVEPPKQ